MIYGFVHPGSGVGNQLHRYVATRVLSLDKGYQFSMIGRESSKVKSFMNLDFGPENNQVLHIEPSSGKIVSQAVVSEGEERVALWEEKTNYYNPEFNFIENNTIIDGEFQSIQYFGHRLNEVREWLEVEPIEIPHDTCVIGFRGGEFYMFPELGLHKSYYDEAIELMKSKGVNNFEVHTDDEVLAKQFFPDFRVVHDVGINWRSIRSAKYSIIANSSFYILPRLLKHHEARGATTIAPRYWARRNTQEWSRPDNYYRCFTYL